jgi:hypothetical protein|tara:strand:+ start:642 stop:1307 length:666 start_codon:yes stop_codon:yes gene_type:complete
MEHLLQSVSDLRPYPLKGIVLVGMGESAWDLMARTFAQGQWWKRLGYELWGINASGYAFRCDKVWSIHDASTMQDIFDELDESCPEAPDGVDPTWMRDLPEVPVVCGEYVKEVKNCLVYPLETVAKAYQTDNFGSTIDYMLAFAGLCPGMEHIWSYGTDFNFHGREDEIEMRRHCVKYWQGRLAERGIQCHFPAGSKLLDDGTYYGFKQEPEFDMEMASGC